MVAQGPTGGAPGSARDMSCGVFVLCGWWGGAGRLYIRVLRELLSQDVIFLLK